MSPRSTFHTASSLRRQRSTGVSNPTATPRRIRIRRPQTLTTRDIAAQEEPVRWPGESNRRFLRRLKEFACMRYAARLVRQGADVQVHRGQLLAAEYGVELEEDSPIDDDGSTGSEPEYDDEEEASEEEAEDEEWDCESEAALTDGSDVSDSESDGDEPSEPVPRRTSSQSH
jgi:hypothetical protein